MSYTFSYTDSNGHTTSSSEYRSAGFGGWNAYGVELRWKSTDITTAPATTFVSPTPSTTSELVSDYHSGLSTGAKAGIGVGAALGGILAILSLGFLILRGRTRVGKDVDQVSDESFREKNQDNTRELDSNPLFEVDGPRRVHPQLSEPVELEG